jgi:hypothetical protein
MLTRMTLIRFVPGALLVMVQSAYVGKMLPWSAVATWAGVGAGWVWIWSAAKFLFNVAASRKVELRYRQHCSGGPRHHRVQVCGDFTNWTPTQGFGVRNAARDCGGQDEYSLEVWLAPGSYNFYFLVDGEVRYLLCVRAHPSVHVCTCTCACACACTHACVFVCARFWCMGDVWVPGVRVLAVHAVQRACLHAVPSKPTSFQPTSFQKLDKKMVPCLRHHGFFLFIFFCCLVCRCSDMYNFAEGPMRDQVLNSIDVRYPSLCVRECAWTCIHYVCVCVCVCV